jgi:hypothetical protein
LISTTSQILLRYPESVRKLSNFKTESLLRVVPCPISVLV